MAYCDACGLEFSGVQTSSSHSCPVAPPPSSDCFTCAVTAINPTGVKSSYPHWYSAFNFLPSLNSLGLKYIAGNFSEHPPSTYALRASPETLALISRCFTNLAPRDLVDHHTHIVGTGDSGSGCYLNSRIFSLKNNPVQYFKMRAFMSGCGLTDFLDADVSMVSRLTTLIEGVNLANVPTQHPRHFILAFDEVYDDKGEKEVTKSTFHVPNDYVLRLAREQPDHFMPCVSIHPYRKDALSELRRCHRAGARLVKWLPNSMMIDPMHSKCTPFYDAMVKLDMTLLCHVGEEHSVDMCGLDNELGNPLRLRAPLDRGVKVIAAHCATEGYASDMDYEGRQECFQLWLRLMDEEKYKGLLFGDISATCAFRRIGYLGTLLDRTDLHKRLVNGSDYPVPALNVVVHTGKLVAARLITSAEKVALDDIYGSSPLLFDFCLKRCLRSANGNRFADGVFKANELLGIVEGRAAGGGGKEDEGRGAEEID